MYSASSGWCAINGLKREANSIRLSGCQVGKLCLFVDIGFVRGGHQVMQANGSGLVACVQRVGINPISA